MSARLLRPGWEMSFVRRLASSPKSGKLATWRHLAIQASCVDLDMVLDWLFTALTLKSLIFESSSAPRNNFALLA